MGEFVLELKKSLKSLYSLVFNTLVKKKERSLFVSCLENNPVDRYDILNYGSSNLLSFLNYYCSIKHEKSIIIYLEYFDDNRLDDYNRFLKMAKANNVKIIFYKAEREKISPKNLIKRLKIDYYRFSSRIWLNESGGTYFAGKLKNQKIVCFNYFISCKNDYLPDKPKSWEFLDYLVTTSLLSSQIISSSTGVLLGNCKICGFPRNDTLFHSNRKKQVLEWIEERIGYLPTTVIVYAPTYRDYESNSCDHRPIFGYKTPKLQQFLIEQNAVLIYKLHPYQKTDVIEDSSCFLRYENSYNYSLYDLLSITDCLICDYSSVFFDFLLLNKPIIFNLYDLDKYVETRGVSYDPYEFFCPGRIVNNESELLHALKSAISNKNEFAHEREMVTKMMHKYTDFQSVARTYKSVIDYIGKEYE